MICKIQDFVGRTMTSVVNNNNHEIVFTTADGEQYRMYHSQDCCESVSIESIEGNLDDLVGEPITLAEEEVSREPIGQQESYESFTWTFYGFATRKGNVIIRWLGESNGYYGEGVDLWKD